MKLLVAIFCFLKIILPTDNCEAASSLPIVINTWNFSNATIQAWDQVYNLERSAVS